MKPVEVTTRVETKLLQQSVKEIFKTVESVRRIFGCDCFTEETRQEIKALDKLRYMLVFSTTLDDLNGQIYELYSEDPKMYSLISKFIKTQLERSNADL